MLSFETADDCTSARSQAVARLLVTPTRRDLEGTHHYILLGWVSLSLSSNDSSFPHAFILAASRRLSYLSIEIISNGHITQVSDGEHNRISLWCR